MPRRLFSVNGHAVPFSDAVGSWCPISSSKNSTPAQDRSSGVAVAGLSPSHTAVGLRTSQIAIVADDRDWSILNHEFASTSPIFRTT